ncbi:MAG: hypothetical protein JW852_11140 [Spirochaetales bacterium]|nr:hypothetical protein [Spirochaetales bacterium]
MRVDRAELFALHIPFHIDFTHSQAKRLASDSLLVKVSAGDVHGYGEAVVRDYVSGSMGSGDVAEHACRAVAWMLEPIRSAGLSMAGLREWSSQIDPPDSELPVLCAVETALLDLLCATKKADIYEVLGKRPARETLVYGGTVPMLPLKAAEALLHRYRMAEMKNLRLKIANDREYNRSLVALARSVMGDGFDLRVDANGAWDVDEALENLAMLADFGISTVEEPFGRDSEKILRCLEDPRSAGFTFVADESILSAADLDGIARSRTYSMINIRLSKNGGLLRSLEIAERAFTYGIAAQLGCHVGETGVLSAAGRVAASLMPDPVYVDGSFDAYLLSENVTRENLAFGRGGLAKTIRGNGLGFAINEEALKRLSYDHRTCI